MATADPLEHREHAGRVRDRTAAHNLAHLRKFALNIVGRDRTLKASPRARRKSRLERFR